MNDHSHSEIKFFIILAMICLLITWVTFWLLTPTEMDMGSSGINFFPPPENAT